MSTPTDQLIALLTQQKEQIELQKEQMEVQIMQQKEQMELQKEQLEMQRKENQEKIKLLTQSAGKKAATATPSFTPFNPSTEL